MQPVHETRENCESVEDDVDEFIDNGRLRSMSRYLPT